MHFGDLYKWGGVIHRDIGAMTLFEFVSATQGHREANGTRKPKGGSISEDRLSELGIEGF